MTNRKHKHPATTRSFGPAVVHWPDGTFRATCTWCTFRIGIKCTHDHRAPRLLHGPGETPDWCPMKASMLADAKEAANG